MTRPTSIAEIYGANSDARATFLDLISGISEADAAHLPDGETWTIAQIVEHVAAVDEGTALICSRLLKKAKEDGSPATGNLPVSDSFAKNSAEIAGRKLEAPERVQPTGEASIADSINKMAATSKLFRDLEHDLAAFDLSGHTYPHPYLGDLTAPEWLLVAGGHELRHAKQIKKRLSQA